MNFDGDSYDTRVIILYDIILYYIIFIISYDILFIIYLVYDIVDGFWRKDRCAEVCESLGVCGAL